MEIDFDSYYSHPRFSGVALRVVGYPRKWEPYTALVTDEDGNEHECDTDEGEWVDDIDSGRVLVVMVGDDHKHTVDVSDLTKINEDDFCDGCGQIGCGHGSKREK